MDSGPGGKPSRANQMLPMCCGQSEGSCLAVNFAGSFGGKTPSRPIVGASGCHLKAEVIYLISISERHSRPESQKRSFDLYLLLV